MGVLDLRFKGRMNILLQAITLGRWYSHHMVDK